MNADFACICNITEQSWMIHRTYGTFPIRGCSAGATENRRQDVPVPENPGPAGTSAALPSTPLGTGSTSAGATSIGYALTEITARKGVMDLGDKRTLEFPISAREIAEDLVREINSDGGEGSFFGAFVCAGSAPSDAELAAAQARLGEFYVRLVATADQNWDRTHNWFMITDVERRAARWLGLEKEWCYDPARATLEECPACAEKVKPGVAVCRSCGAILDPEKAARFGLAPSGALAPLAGARGEPSGALAPAGAPLPAGVTLSAATPSGASARSAGFHPGGLCGESSGRGESAENRRQDAGATERGCSAGFPPAFLPADAAVAAALAPEPIPSAPAGTVAPAVPADAAAPPKRGEAKRPL